MRPHLVAVLLSLTAACVPRYTKFREQDQAEFTRQDSSAVHRAVDELVREAAPFRSLPQVGLTPKEIVVSQGDSAWLYQALAIYMTFRQARAPDACAPPSRVSFVAWKDLGSRTGIDAVALYAAGDTNGIRDTFSSMPSNCNGPILTLHHPMLSVGRIIDRQWRSAVTSTGKGQIFVDLGRGRTRPCPAAAITYLESQSILAECRVTWIQVWISTRIGGKDGAASDSFFVGATVPALHLWMDCQANWRAREMCPPLPPVPDTLPRREVSPPLEKRPSLVTVTGVVKEVEEGIPIPYAWIRVDRGSTIFADSGGRFTIQLPPGRATAMAGCFGRGGSSEQSQDPFVVRHYMAELVFFLIGSNCVRPPGPVPDSVFEGIYDSGLERSRFSLCGKRQYNVWAGFTPQAEAERDEQLARLKGKESYEGFLWRVRGALAGPGRFGPKSDSEYLLTVERVLEVRVRQRNECAR